MYDYKLRSKFWIALLVVLAFFGAIGLAIGLTVKYAWHMFGQMFKAIVSPVTPNIADDGHIPAAWKRSEAWAQKYWPSKVYKRSRKALYVPDWVWIVLLILFIAYALFTYVFTGLTTGDWTTLPKLLLALPLGVLLVIVLLAWLWELIPWRAMGYRIQRWFKKWWTIWPALVFFLVFTLLVLLTPQPASLPPTTPPTNADQGQHKPVTTQPPVTTPTPSNVPKEVTVDGYGDFAPNAQVTVNLNAFYENGDTGYETFIVGTAGEPKVSGSMRLPVTKVDSATWRITYQTEQGPWSFVIGREGVFMNPFFRNEISPLPVAVCEHTQPGHGFDPGFGQWRSVNSGDTPVLYGRYDKPGPLAAGYGTDVATLVSIEFRAYFAHGRWWAEPVTVVKLDGENHTVGFTPAGPYVKGGSTIC